MIKKSLSIGELWFLLRQAAPAVIVGLEDPHRGLSVDEVLEEDRKALASLIEKGLVIKSGESEIEVDDSLMDMIKVMADPEDTVLIDSTRGSVHQQDYVYHRNNTFVEYHVEDTAHCLQLLNDRNQLLDILKEQFKVSDAQISEPQQFSLAEVDLFEVRSLFVRGKQVEARRKIDSLDIPEVCSKEFSEAIFQPELNGSISVLSSVSGKDDFIVHGTAIVSGAASVWKLSPYSQNENAMVKCTRIDAKEFASIIEDLIP